MEDPKLAIGSPVWIFDSNRRVYAKGKNGVSTGGPIWREHWVRREISGETRVSWIIGKSWNEWKLPKRNPRQRTSDGYNQRVIAFSEAEIDDMEWTQVHCRRISHAVERISDAAVLRKIAEMIDYKAEG